jgi:ATP-dependent RNA helicase DeaD
MGSRGIAVRAIPAPRRPPRPSAGGRIAAVAAPELRSSETLLNLTPSPQRGRRDGGSRRPRGARKPAKPRGPEPEELHPTLEPPDVPSFAHWALDPGILQGIANMGIEKPTPIQALSVQPVLDGRDLIAKAETGTGKTLAFGAPIMSRVDPERATVLALVLCPTRELAQQVAGVLATLGVPRKVQVALVVGGDPMHPQVEELRKGAQVVVGTPGRVLDLYQQRFLSFPWTEYAVLDEADKMFEIGFLDDVRKILSLLPDERQTLLFSATYPREVLGLAREFTTDPVEVATARGLATVDTIDQGFMGFEEESDRALALIRMVEASDDDDVFLVFLERRTEVDRLLRRLDRERFTVKALHGGYDQASRFRVMSAFRAQEVKVLLATDVAARGLDVEHVTHVVNYAVPREVESYTHRIGRTGRAGRSGKAITFVQPADRRRWQAILKDVRWPIEELPLPGTTRRRAPAARSSSEERPARAERSDRDQPRRRGGRDRDEAERPQPARRAERDEGGGKPDRSAPQETARGAAPEAEDVRESGEAPRRWKPGQRGERSPDYAPPPKPRRSRGDESQ